MKRFFALLCVLFSLGSTAHVADAAEAVSKAVVVQANGSTVEEFKRGFTLAINMKEAMPDAAFEIVVYGPNVRLLTAFSDELPIVQKAQAAGIVVIACGRSLKTDDIKESDMAPDIRVVPFGAVWIVNRQKQGWQYIRS